MQDKLEEFFKDNKDDFDAHEPPEQLWRSVNNELQRKKRNVRRTYYAAAASVVLVIGSFAWFMNSTPKNALPGNVAHATPNVNDTEAYYAILIDKQRAQLEQFSKTYPEVCKDFGGEIDTLNHVLYGQLKVEYKNSNGNEAVLQAMIENLRTQVQLLNSQMQVILTIKQKENKQGQKNS